MRAQVRERFSEEAAFGLTVRDLVKVSQAEEGVCVCGRGVQAEAATCLRGCGGTRDSLKSARPEGSVLVADPQVELETRRAGA